MTMKDLMMGHAAVYPAPAVAPLPAAITGATQQSCRLAPYTLARIEREARAMQLTPDQLVDRALLALADEVDAERRSRAALPPGDER
ncbi:hypothetical protein CRM94_22910 [Burkholderia gladioli]|uniref:Uncharacterized protein n=2 Tax=Burkholderia gladioli TaxID=28095 RepID=A0A2A7S1I0_BURGA|nr:hypothetical protein [Burkholderia gladioli]ASD80420.1 hypothetical protein CEJ98_16515 [Burkholderia gladioli pv. gladioli]AWY54340.1 hypothetical protein A8H28_24610 [Burkholderia gladioli pv. gladioli]PEH37396.1 hypothetical protein CRM94_22910 [Burkholderia gladioli]